jgi:hypothetical protein
MRLLVDKLLVKGDWVAPYGKGEVSDFIFKVEGTEREEPSGRRFPDVFFDYTLTVTFSNPDDGIQPGLPHENEGGFSKS